jgi:hypothetical protein
MRVFSKPPLYIGVLVLLVGAIVWFTPANRRAELLAALPGLQSEPTEAEESASYAQAQEEDDVELDRVVLVDGMPAVRLTKFEQRYSGISTSPLKRMTYRAESQAYGKVEDIRPLLKMRARFNAARAYAKIAQARLQVSAREYERLQSLNEQSNLIPASRMHEALAQRRIDQARLHVAQFSLRNIRAQAVQVWGSRLTAMVLAEDNRRLQRLVERRDVLLRVTLAPNFSMPVFVDSALVERGGERRRARKAKLISSAPQADPTAQGETYFFQTRPDGLRTGMRVLAWIPQHKAPEGGVLVPAAATVWRQGRPWVYVQKGEELFIRRSIAGSSEVAGGWFSGDGFSIGEQVVVSGAQMLLSEEFRGQIPEEDDD